MTQINAIDKYETGNLEQQEAEKDQFTVERYRQFASLIPADARVVVDVGCSTGRGGAEVTRLRPDIELWGLDVVQSRLDALPPAYSTGVRGLSTEIPLADRSVHVVLAGEFLEHLDPRDVDLTLCEFQRILEIGGRLLITTPNPNYVRHRLQGTTVYGPGHLTQHHARVLKMRMKMHGFKAVHVSGSGKMSRHIGRHFPVPVLYGSYLLRADKR